MFHKTAFKPGSASASELMNTLKPLHNMISNSVYIPMAFPLGPYRF